MAGFTGAPPIVTDGLSYSLDFANYKVYTSGSTSATPIGGGSANLVNSPTFSNEKGGTFRFDGTNDYISSTHNISPESNFITCDIVCILPESLNGMLLKFGGGASYNIFCPGGNFGLNTFNGNCYGVSSSQINTLGVKGKWAYYSIVVPIYPGESDLTNTEIYINGVSYPTANRASSNYTNNLMIISSTIYPISDSYNMDVKFGIFNVYNRKLTSSEIWKNYISHKSRFNID